MESETSAIFEAYLEAYCPERMFGWRDPKKDFCINKRRAICQGYLFEVNNSCQEHTPGYFIATKNLLIRYDVFSYPFLPYSLKAVSFLKPSFI